MRTIFYFFVISIFAAICAASFFYGREIPFVQQWPLYESLRTTAAIIFAVVGAWLAIIYPERLKLSFGKKNGQTSQGGNMGLLLTPAVHSSIILIAVLFIGILAPILKQIPQLLEYRDLFRGLAFLLLAALTLWQIIIVVMTIIPSDMVKLMADTEKAQQQVSEHYNKLIKK